MAMVVMLNPSARFSSGIRSVRRVAFPVVFMAKGMPIRKRKTANPVMLCGRRYARLMTAVIANERLKVTRLPKRSIRNPAKGRKSMADRVIRLVTRLTWAGEPPNSSTRYTEKVELTNAIPT